MKRVLSWILVIALVLTAFPLSLAAAEEAPEKALMLPNGLVEIEDGAFEGDTSITTVVVPNTVMKIGAGAFKNCANLSAIAFGSENIDIAPDAFDGCSKENLVFTIHSGTKAEKYAIAHGFRSESLDSDNSYSQRFSALLSYSGFDTSILMSDEYASNCLIVRTPAGKGRIPDISQYNPEYIFRSEDDLFFIQFSQENDTRDCFLALKAQEGSGVASVEVDHAGESETGTARNVAVASWWGTSDPMGFTAYGNFVNQHASRDVTIAVVDSGVGSWSGKSFERVSFADSNGNNSVSNHASNIAEIISDCVGVNRSRINLLSVKILNSGSVYRTTTIIQGIKYAAEHADIVNLSLGIDAESPEIKYQIDRASNRGVLFVAAAGNGTTGSVLFPARYGKTIAVSALSYSQEDGYRVRSRTGNAIDFTAPGMKLAISSNPDLTSADDTLSLASTSYAAPQITAALALIMMDGTKNGGAVSTLAGCCDTLNETGHSSAYGNGLPRLDRLAEVKGTDIVLSNADGEIPTRMWKSESFLLMWRFVPEDTTNKAVTVSTDTPDVIEVQQYGSAYALIKAKGTGNGKVTVSAENVTKELDILVEQPVTSIAITGASDNLVVGKTVKLGAVVGPEEARNKDFSWRSGNETIATVSPAGLVTGLSTGTVRIYAEAQDGFGTSAYVTINVIEIPDAESISISSPDADLTDREVALEVGETLKLNFVILPELAPQEVTYRALPAGIVEVSEAGVVRALKAGNATIVVTATTGNSVIDYLSVTVKVSPTGVTVTAPKTTLDIGEGIQAQATIQPANATETALTWETSDSAIAIVNSTGYITAVGPGTAMIKARTVNGKEGSVNIVVRKPITITLNANGGEVQQTKIYAYAGYEIGELPEATRSYYAFGGWYTKASGGTTVTAASKFDDDTTIYVHWTPEQYIVSFDANEGTCSVATMQARVDTALGALPEPTRTGYTFVGWYTEAAEGDKITSTYQQPTTAGLQLYAHWSAKPYSVTFNANGGACAETSIQAEVDAPIGNLPTAERASYTFGGWFTEENTEVTPEYQQATDDTLRLFAHWIPNTYTITLDPGAGSCGTPELTGTVDTAIGELPGAERQYYQFAGWFTDTNIRVTSDYQQATDDPITLYAHWTPKAFTVTLNANGGSCNTAEVTAYVDTDFGVLPAAVRQYYEFAGWYIDTDDGAVPVLTTYQRSTDEPVTLYAHWTPNSYTMTFDPNGGSCSTESITGQVATAIGTLPVPTLENYRFDGWFTSANETGTQVTSTYAQTHDNDITVYAHWTLLIYQVTFDKNASDAVCGTTSRQATAGVALGTLPVPTRSYYTFGGWFTAASGGTQVTSTYTQATATPLTLYAHWELNPVSGWVTYSSMPADAQIIENKWSYKEVTESTSSSLSGWTNNGSYWKATGSGSKNYASIPSTFKQDHWIATSFARSILSSSETATTKRDVYNDRNGGYVYWHWMYNVAYAAGTTRPISDRTGTWNANGGTSGGYAYSYFYAFTSGTAAPYLDNYYCCSRNQAGYNCHNILPSGFPTGSTGGVGTDRFFRFSYRTCDYTDYTKYYNYYRYLESSSAVSVGGNITEVTRYVRYRAK